MSGKSMTFYEFTNLWTKDYAEHELAPTTYARYKGMLESRILPYFGHFKPDAIKPPAYIMNFYDYLSKETQIKRRKNHNSEKTLKPLSSKTILEHHRLLRAMLQNAVYWQFLFENPASRVRPPKSKRPKIKYYDDAECRLLLDALKHAEMKYQMAVILTLFTGMRRGELLGLTWDDINLKEGYVNIDKANQYLADRGIFTKDPKTESSTRGIAIPDTVVKSLVSYKEWYNEQKRLRGSKWTETNKLFVQWNGKPIHPDTMSKWFKDFVKEQKLPPLTFHGLRHTNATLLISQNIDVAVVASRLGHAQITTTLNFYVHPVASHNKLAGNVLEQLLVN